MFFHYDFYTARRFFFSCFRRQCRASDFSMNPASLDGFMKQAALRKQPLFPSVLTNAVTGETVQEIPMTSSLSRPDLESRTGSGSTPGFYTSIDWNALGGGLYTASIISGGKTVGNSLSHYSGSKNSESGLPEGVSSVQNLGSFRITGYCACRKCSAGWGGRTSSGAMAVSRRTVAVDPRVIPMGSRLLINGQVYVAEDVGGGVKGNHVDIYCDSHAQAKSLPFQSAQVFLLR